MMNRDARDAIVAFRIEKARKTLGEIPILLEHELWNTAVNRLYYSCFFAVTALLTNRQIEAKNSCRRITYVIPALYKN